VPKLTWPIERLWFYGTLCYCLVVCGAAWIAHVPRGSMPPLIRMLFAPAMLSFAAHAIYTGQIIGRWGTSCDQDARPIAFWLGVLVYMAACIFLLVTGLR
jgi:hypothetical protein